MNTQSKQLFVEYTEMSQQVLCFSSDYICSFTQTGCWDIVPFTLEIGIFVCSKFLTCVLQPILDNMVAYLNLNKNFKPG